MKELPTRIPLGNDLRIVKAPGKEMKSPCGTLVRFDERGEIDEVLGREVFLEYMEDSVVWMRIGQVHLFLTADSKITANCRSEDDPQFEYGVFRKQSGSRTTDPAEAR